jgi:hypothetical protein
MSRGLQRRLDRIQRALQLAEVDDEAIRDFALHGSKDGYWSAYLIFAFTMYGVTLEELVGASWCQPPCECETCRRLAAKLAPLDRLIEKYRAASPTPVDVDALKRGRERHMPAREYIRTA